jgi:hypothetical protein
LYFSIYLSNIAYHSPVYYNKASGRSGSGAGHYLYYCRKGQCTNCCKSKQQRNCDDCSVLRENDRLGGLELDFEGWVVGKMIPSSGSNAGKAD